jgi:glyoxylase-like metal-dependent hydrolase (beta-lactamase superfamily II)
MIELVPDIFYIPGENNSCFPHCACLYLKGHDMRVLIDAGMGAANLAPAKKMGIDLLILTHCHIDHRLTRQEITDVPVWCHEAEAPYLSDPNLYRNAIGLQRSGLDLEARPSFPHDLFDVKVDRYVFDGQRIDLGGITLEVILTPGHSPGHLAFYIPEADLLFAADVDLTPFGPFYGHDFADIEEFLNSIERLKQLNAKIATTGHAGPFKGQVVEKFDAYAEMIYRRDKLIIKQLKQPMRIDDFRDRNLIFRSYPDFPDLLRWFEIVHIEKHLERLKALGKVKCHDGIWMTTAN